MEGLSSPLPAHHPSQLELLTDRHYDKAERAVDMLAARPTTLGEPYSRHLGGEVA
jgi:hypothetical protein